MAAAKGAARPRSKKTTAPDDDQRQAARLAQRGKNGGWLKIGGWGEQSGGRTPTVLRDKAREVLAELGYPELANIITDPLAKDSDKLRAVDILMKASVGYMTPEQAMGEDAPELPAPIFETTDGPLPGDEDAVRTDAQGVERDDAGMIPGESRGTPTGSATLEFPQRPVEPLPSSGGGGPMPYVGGL